MGEEQNNPMDDWVKWALAALSAHGEPQRAVEAADHMMYLANKRRNMFDLEKLKQEDPELYRDIQKAESDRWQAEDDELRKLFSENSEDVE